MARRVLHVRCEAHALVGADAAWLARFLRGFVALYGDGLAVDSVSHSTAVVLAQAAEVPGDDIERVGSFTSATELFLVVQLMEQDERRATVRTAVIFGRSAIGGWMRANLFEARYALQSSSLSDLSQQVLPPPIRVFISGDLVGALLRLGYKPSEVGYIKPATQCEQPQLIAKFCQQHGIACCDIGPILFYSGFTREFLKGTTDSSAELLAKAKAKVDEIGRGKRVVVIDGVGYPAVGSICGVSNADVASAVEAPVVLVGKKGVGDAVDSFNLNACFFESKRVKVLGAIFNRLPPDGFYSLDKCRESVTEYFTQFQPDKGVYGFIPELPADEEKAPEPSDSKTHAFMTPEESTRASRVIDTFAASVDLPRLLEDAKRNQSARPEPPTRSITSATSTNGNKRSAPQVDAQYRGGSIKKTRQQIQAAALVEGAKGG
jgi:dethiobiotin synthetase